VRVNLGVHFSDGAAISVKHANRRQFMCGQMGHVVSDDVWDKAPAGIDSRYEQYSSLRYRSTRKTDKVSPHLHESFKSYKNILSYTKQIFLSFVGKKIKPVFSGKKNSFLTYLSVLRSVQLRYET
jgi:hypothetical protein